MEIYPEDLELFTFLMNKLPGLAVMGNVEEIEIRVRTVGGTNWAVIGIGEAGDPCIIRFDGKKQ